MSFFLWKCLLFSVTEATAKMFKRKVYVFLQIWMNVLKVSMTVSLEAWCAKIWLVPSCAFVLLEWPGDLMEKAVQVKLRKERHLMQFLHANNSLYACLMNLKVVVHKVRLRYLLVSNISILLCIFKTWALSESNLNGLGSVLEEKLWFCFFSCPAVSGRFSDTC